MREDIVLVPAFDGKPLKRCVWAVADNAVYVTNDDQFAKLHKGKDAIEPIAFLRKDVFRHTEGQSWTDNTFDWSKLLLWQPGRTPYMFRLRQRIGTQCKRRQRRIGIQPSMFSE